MPELIALGRPALERLAAVVKKVDGYHVEDNLEILRDAWRQAGAGETAPQHHERRPRGDASHWAQVRAGVLEAGDL